MTFKGNGHRKNKYIFFRLFQAPRLLIESTCHRFLRRLKSGSLSRQPVQAPLQVLKVNLDRPGQARLGRPVQAIMSSTDECSPTSFSADIGLANDHICDISGTAGQAQDNH